MPYLEIQWYFTELGIRASKYEFGGGTIHSITGVISLIHFQNKLVSNYGYLPVKARDQRKTLG